MAPALMRAKHATTPAQAGSTTPHAAAHLLGIASTALRVSSVPMTARRCLGV
jgi:hypothetical protein